MQLEAVSYLDAIGPAGAGSRSLQTKAPIVADRTGRADPHPRVHRCAQNIFERFRADANVRQRRSCSDLLRGASIGFGLAMTWRRQKDGCV